MDPTELDRLADLLRRWQEVDGPMERVRIVTDATDALRSLSSMDTRVLAQGLWEHGAGPAAEQVAQRAGNSNAPEELALVAQEVLNLDHREVEQLAHELRDPDQRRRLLSNSGVALEEVARHLPERPPEGEPLDLPPPPETVERPDPPLPDDETPDAPGSESDASDPPDPPSEAPDPPDPASDPPGTPPVSQPADARGQDPVRTGSAPAAREPARPAQNQPPSKTTLDPAAGLAKMLEAAPNGRQRLRHLQQDPVVLHGTALLGILDAVPDGWQRRTVLRRLVAADRVGDLPAADVVSRFARDGDRFAVAALLVRTGTCELDAVLPPLRPSDADRLRRRAKGPQRGGASHSRRD